jgi:hypothetical protein
MVDDRALLWRVNGKAGAAVFSASAL